MHCSSEESQVQESHVSLQESMVIQSRFKPVMIKSEFITVGVA